VGIASFKELDVWKIAHQNVLEIYRITKSYPRDEMFGLSSQMRRSAVSIPANIAEGFGRRQPRDKARYYNIAQASIEELRYYLILSKDLGYVEDAAAVGQSLDSVARMLKKLVLRMSGQGYSSPSSPDS